MARFTHDSLDRLRDAVDMVELVSAHTDLRRQGTQFSGRCPFHEERTPSFSVDPGKRVYHCFGCGASGDHISFVREKEGLEFVDAVEWLAERFGVQMEMSEPDPGAEERRRLRDRLLALTEKACAHYERVLWQSPEAQPAREYLSERGLEPDTLRAFRIGFSPDSWDRILTTAREADFTEAEITGAGLAVVGGQGRPYDRFRGRIMFPVADARGRVVGFGARAIAGDDGPKYLNSPEGPLFHKERLLFGLDRARAQIGRSGEAIVSEGYTDVLALHQAGFTNTVAVMGTALGERNIGQLAALARRILLALDADRAGERGMLRLVDVAARRSMELAVIPLPAGADPCDVVSEGGPDAFRDLAARAVPLRRFHLERALAGEDLATPQGRDRALAAVSPIVAGVPQSAERDEIVDRIAEAINVDHAVVLTRTRGAPGVEGREGGRSTRAGADRGGRRTAPVAPVLDETERTFLAMCVASPDPGLSFLKRLEPEHFTTEVLRGCAAAIAEDPADPTRAADPEDRDLAAALSEIAVRSASLPCSAAAIEEGFLRLERSRIDRALRAANARGEDTRDMQRERARLAEAIDEAAGRA